MRKKRCKRFPPIRCYRCVVTYLDYEHDGEPSHVRTLHFGVDVRYFESFCKFIDDNFDFYTISPLNTFYSSEYRVFFSLI